MRKTVLICVLTTVTVVPGRSDIFNNKLFLTLSGSAGYYLLPDRVEGNIDDVYDYYYDSYPNHYVDASVNSYDGYSTADEDYRHSFPSETDLNLGFGIQAAYFILPNFAVGFEYANSFSTGEYRAGYAFSDTVQYGYYSHEYSTFTTTTEDRLYLKHTAIGFLGIYRTHWKTNMELDLGIGMGMADYLQVFQLDYDMVEEQYNSSDVLTDTYRNSDFTTFGIKYHSFYLKPQAAVRYLLSPRLAARVSLTLPLSFVEKGSLWNSDGGDYYYETSFYPDSRFTAGNLSVGGGFELCY